MLINYISILKFVYALYMFCFALLGCHATSLRASFRFRPPSYCILHSTLLLYFKKLKSNCESDFLSMKKI